VVATGGRHFPPPFSTPSPASTSFLSPATGTEFFSPGSGQGCPHQGGRESQCPESQSRIVHQASLSSLQWEPGCLTFCSGSVALPVLLIFRHVSLPQRPGGQNTAPESSSSAVRYAAPLLIFAPRSNFRSKRSPLQAAPASAQQCLDAFHAQAVLKGRCCLQLPARADALLQGTSSAAQVLQSGERERACRQSQCSPPVQRPLPSKGNNKCLPGT